MRGISSLGAALGVLLVAACGGGGGGGTPTAPTPGAPTPSGKTVYASFHRSVYMFSGDPGCGDTVLTGDQKLWMPVGWIYGNDEKYGGWYFRGGTFVLTFDLPSEVAGRVVAKAILRLSAVSLHDATTSVIRVNALASDWDRSTLTWNILAGLPVHATGEAQAPVPASLGPLDFDVTTIVRNWVSNSWANHGLKFSADRSSAPDRVSWEAASFHSPQVYDQETQRPHLMIDFQ